MEGHLDIWKIMWSSGPVVKLVLFLLIMASVCSWAIILKKRKTIKMLKEANEYFIKAYQDSKNLDEVMDKVAGLPFSPYRSIFINGHGEWEKIRGPLYNPKHLELARKHLESFGPVAIERSIQKGVNDVNQELDSMLSTLASIGSITPFVGLFGTVWGIINSFSGMASGGAGLDAVAPGIAEALVATAVGLAAAIPAIWFYNDLNAKNSMINVEMESFGKELLNQIERSVAYH